MLMNTPRMLRSMTNSTNFKAIETILKNLEGLGDVVKNLQTEEILNSSKRPKSGNLLSVES